MVDHHPAILSLDWNYAGAVPAGFTPDFLGIIRKNNFDKVILESKQAVVYQDPVIKNPPAFNEEYFERIDLIESAEQAKETFRMFELGAGYGRWTMRGLGVVRSLGISSMEFMAVEAEPTHFAWLRENFKDNGLDPGKHRLVNAAVSEKDGATWFYVGKPAEWYGQRIASGTERLTSRDYQFQKVQKISLKTLLDGSQSIDFIDSDVQGAELEVFSSARKELEKAVKRYT